MSEKINYDDVKEYENLFMMVPPFLLERFAKRNKNFVSKFSSQVQSHISGLNDEQRNKLDIILNSSVDDLQAVMDDAYRKSGVKQYRVLANPKYKKFIETNINELKKII